VRFSPFWWLPSLMATLRLSHLPTGTAAHDPFFIYDTVRFDAKFYLPFCTLAYIYTFERCVACINYAPPRAFAFLLCEAARGWNGGGRGLRNEEIHFSWTCDLTHPTTTWSSSSPCPSVEAVCEMTASRSCAFVSTDFILELFSRVSCQGWESERE
jgi:hypothetical protein